MFCVTLSSAYDVMPDVNADGTWRIPIRAHHVPTADVHDDVSRYQITVQLPGVSRDKVKLNVAGNTLTLSGERVVNPNPSLSCSQSSSSFATDNHLLHSLLSLSLCADSRICEGRQTPVVSGQQNAGYILFFVYSQFCLISTHSCVCVQSKDTGVSHAQCSCPLTLTPRKWMVLNFLLCPVLLQPTHLCPLTFVCSETRKWL